MAMLPSQGMLNKEKSFVRHVTWKTIMVIPANNDRMVIRESRMQG